MERNAMRQMPGRVRRLQVAAVMTCFLALAAVAPANAYDAAVDKAALKTALQQYGSCSGDCAAALVPLILNASVDVGLKTLGTMKATEKASKMVKYASFYALIRMINETGAKVLKEHKACYETCDSLNKEIVELGRAGLLGPMLKDGKIDEAAFSNQRIIDAFTKFLKPIQLPAEEKGEAWAKYISSLS